MVPMVEPVPELPESRENPALRRLALIPARDLLVCLSLILTTVAICAQVWRFALVNYDDMIYVGANSHIRGGFTLASLKWVLFSLQPDNWFPVTRLSHLVDYTLFGDRSGYYHAVSVFIHACASVLLYGFLRSTQMAFPQATLAHDFEGRNPAAGRWAAAFVAFLFAVHPLHVESVAWVSERKDVLCAFFWFAALWAWVEWVKRPSERRYFLSLALFGLGLMSKPMIVTFPVLLLLLDIWPLRRPFSLAARLSWVPIREKLPFFLLSSMDTYLTWLAQRGSGAVHSLAAYSLSLRIENAVVTPWIYIGKTVWPASLSAIYSWPESFPLWQPVAGGIALLVVSVAVLAVVRQRPWLAVGWFWFLVTILPVIGIVQVGEQARADRYMYVPMVGLSLMIVGGAAGFLASRPSARRPAAALACAVLIVLSVRSWSQARYWQDSQTLFEHAIGENPLNYAAWYYLGRVLLTIPGQGMAGIGDLETAVRIKPDFFDAHEHLAVALCAAGLDVEGLSEFDRALREKPHDARVNFDLGNALVKLGRIAEAIPHFRDAVRFDPQEAPPQLALGLALEKPEAGRPGNPDEAVKHLERAVQLDPANAVARCELGNALSDVPSRTPEAVHSFEEALAIDPNYAASHYGLGKVLLKTPGTAFEGTLHLEVAQRLELERPPLMGQATGKSEHFTGDCR